MRRKNSFKQRQDKPRSSVSDLYKISRYEEMKQVWVLANPRASSSEYETALRAIAEKCGI